MKNFDEERNFVPLDEEDRRFQLGGETFTLRARVRPEVLIPATRITNGSAMEDDIANIDAALAALLEPESAERFTRLRAREDDPITYKELLPVIAYAVEVTAGRPTKPSASSGNGDAASTDASKAGSSLRAVEA